MKLNIKEDQLHVRAFFAECACRCCFCCVGDNPHDKRISFDDYEKIVRKFANIGASHSMRLASYIFNTIEHSHLGRQIALFRELGIMDENDYTCFDINGTRIRTTDEIIKWFEKLREAGMKKVAFSWFGLEKQHDDFVNYSGCYRYLMKCAEYAHELSIPVISKVYLHKGILNEVANLVSILERFSTRIIMAFMEHNGRGKEIERFFLTESEYHALPDRIKKIFRPSYLKKFKTEKEWGIIAENGQFPQFTLVDYVIYLYADNIDYYLNADVDEVIDDFRKHNDRFQKSVGDIGDLAKNYGDRECLILYECRDILRKWLDLHYAENNLNTSDLFSYTTNSVEWKVYERLQY